MTDTNKHPDDVHLHLLDYDEDYIKELNYYELLGLHPTRCTAYDIKQKYRKACLRYHPDKTGRDAESDYVFLGIKAAYDTLSDPTSRLSYDSTAMPFDDYIPGANESTFLTDETAFYDMFAPVFERNLRFDAKILSKETNNNMGGSSHQKNKRNSKTNNNNNNNNKKQEEKKPPSLGNADSPIDDVNAFYEYWTHFESWRDFSMQAQTELFSENNNPLEDAESRYEKRFYQKEIDKRAKQLKKQEMNRIQTLVQRARNADPRLKRYQQEQAQLKAKQAEEKRIAAEKLAAEQKLQKEREEKERIQREEEEKQQKQQQKQQREKEKKLLRKAKQQLRKLSVAYYQEHENDDNNNYYTSLEQIGDDVEYLCTQLSLEQLNELSETFGKENVNCFSVLHEEVSKYKQLDENAQQLKEQEKILQQQKELQQQEERKKANENPWSKDELSALAKGVKKFPPGGANRWEQISNFVNNVCRPQIPRTKEECIDKYNQIARGGGSTPAQAAQQQQQSSSQDQQQQQEQPEEPASQQQQEPQQSPQPASQPQSPPAQQKQQESTTTTPTPAAKEKTTTTTTTTATNSSSTASENGSSSPAKAEQKPTTETNGEDTWTEEQDKQLQAGLAQYPTTMDKNERWTAIAKGVPGKTKKQCVQRFKAIRDAIKNKK